jgi:hypothetical protein
MFTSPCRWLAASGELQRAPPRPGHAALRSAAGPAGGPGLRARPAGSQQRNTQALAQGEQVQWLFVSDGGLPTFKSVAG